jgi:hypothetical protein
MQTKPQLITDNPELLHYIAGKLHITVLGGIKFTALDRLKVTLKMVVTDNKQNVFRHNADLYNSIQVGQLVERSAETLDFNATEISAAISNLTTALEEYRAEHLESLKPKAPEKIQLTDSERKVAISFLKSPNLLNQTQQAITNSGITGEESNALIAYLIFTSRKRMIPLHLICLGASGTGKTWLQEKVGELMPDEDKLEITTLSNNAFYYFGKIADIITKLCLKGDAAVYCSRDSRKKLRLNGYNQVHTELRDFKKYNFLTSRFYSAVDIDYPLHQCNPTIIMLTDLVFAPHTMIDPGSEAIQIVGRFRKDKKVVFTKEIYHITNINPHLESMSRSEVYKYIDECHLIYSAVERFYLTATTKGAKDTIRQMLERCDYRRFINEHDGSRNYYMVDNMIHEEKVKRAYQCKKQLLKSYKDSKAFILKDHPSEEYAYTDKQRLENRKSAPLKSLTKIVSDTIKDLHSGKYTDFQIQIELANLQLDFPNVMAPINKIGLEEAAKLQYDLYKIKAKIEKNEKEKDSFGLMTYIKDNFTPGHKYTPAQIEHILSIGFKQLNLTGLTPSVRLLRKFCEIPRDRRYMGKDENGNDIRGYLIIRFWDNVN